MDYIDGFGFVSRERLLSVSLVAFSLLLLMFVCWHGWVVYKKAEKFPVCRGLYYVFMLILAIFSIGCSFIYLWLVHYH
ncbi:MAG: hypothetical protein WCT18_02115 [Patescibacteria group bacterium]